MDYALGNKNPRMASILLNHAMKLNNYIFMDENIILNQLAECNDSVDFVDCLKLLFTYETKPDTFTNNDNRDNLLTLAARKNNSDAVFCYY